MNTDFQEITDQLHDARVFGFLFDNDRSKFKFDFYLYIQLFDEFKDEAYQLKKALLRFSDAKIDVLSITNDLSRGQYFITTLNIIQKEKGIYQFDAIFNSDDVKLSLSAASIEIIVSEKTGYSSDQYLKTSWHELLKM